MLEASPAQRAIHPRATEGAEGATELLVGVQWLVGRVPVAFHTRGLPPVAPPIVATASVIVSSDSSSA